MPGLKELELHEITFMGRNTNIDSSFITRHDLFNALSTRNTPPGRLIMTYCDIHGFACYLEEMVRSWDELVVDESD